VITVKIPPTIRAHHVSLSEAAKSTILKKASKLDSFYDRITSCRVVVDAPHRHQSKGLLYNVRIDLTVPGRELVIKREPHEDLYVAIRDAFDAARRQLKDFALRQRGDIKTHEAPPHGRVSKLFPKKGYGFIETPDGLEIYFHKNSVLNSGFDRLEIGAEVRFVQEPGEHGPQASTVTVI
jgi:ribosomal subunit interface protein